MKSTLIYLGTINNKFIEGMYWIFTFFFTSLYSAWIFRDRVWELSRHGVPLNGDGASTGLFLDTVHKSSWFDLITLHLVNTHLGFPGILDYSLQPTGHILELFFIKGIWNLLSFRDAETVVHWVAVMKAPFIAMSMMVFLRTLRVRYYIAIPLAISYATLSFNLIRAEGHFFLGLTWSIPLGLASLICILRVFRAEKSDSTARRNIVKSGLLALPIGFSSFYYSIFMLLISLAVFFSCFLYFATQTYVNSKTTAWKSLLTSLRVIRWCFLYLSCLILGFVYQISLLLYQSHNILTLSSLGNREPSVAPIVYSGSLESLFFDSTKTILQFMKQFGLLNFLSSRTNWEGSQAGAITGLILYLLIFLFYVLVTQKPIFNVRIIKIDNTKNLTILTGILICCVILYLPTPLNYFFSLLMPQIRVWGRLTIVIAAVAIAIFAILLSSSKKRYAIVLLSCLLFAHQLEVLNFRNSRAAAAQVDNSKNQQARENRMVLSAMEGKIPKGCSILYLPIYPYPEFDFPNDQVGDYSPLSLIRVADDNFYWSYPSVKNTEHFAPFQRLVSDQPDFIRSTLLTQLSVGKRLHFCATLVDKLMLSSAEIDELNSLIQRIPKKCHLRNSLPDQGIYSRYEIFDNRRDCLSDLPLELSSAETIQMPGDPYIWRILTPYSSRFDSSWEIFSKEKAITIRLAQKSNRPMFTRMHFNISIYHQGRLKIKERQQICLQQKGEANWHCLDALRGSDHSTLSFVVPITFSKRNKTDITFRLGINTDDFNEWAIALR